MPTREQVKATIDRIKEVISIPYLEGEEYDVDEPPPRSGLEPIPFHALTRGDRIEILDMLVNWEGFTDAQRGRVIRHVIEGLGPESWMDGIEPEGGTGRSVDRLIADFHARVEAMKRDGVPDYPPLGGRLPWAEATEERKLQTIVWESMSVWLEGNGDRFQTIDVPGIVRLEAVERNVDYDKLPEDWRNALKSLRAETGQADDRHIAAELERITGLEYDDDEPDGAPMHEKPVPAETAPRLRMNQAPDCYTGLMTELEAFADRFESLARTPEQEALAKGFGEFVAGPAHATLRYLTAEALRPDPAPADFDRLMAESAAVAPDPPDPDRGIEP